MLDSSEAISSWKLLGDCGQLVGEAELSPVIRQRGAYHDLLFTTDSEVHAIRHAPASPECTVRRGVEGQGCANAQMARWLECARTARQGTWTRLVCRSCWTWQCRCTAPKCSLVAEAGALHRREQANFDIRLALSLCFPLTTTTYTDNLASQHILAHIDGCKYASNNTLTSALTSVIGNEVATFPRPFRPATAGRAIASFKHTYHHSMFAPHVPSDAANSTPRTSSMPISSTSPLSQNCAKR
jgi:hypothetical protein